jgi:hypothetical protein
VSQCGITAAPAWEEAERGRVIAILICQIVLSIGLASIFLIRPSVTSGAAWKIVAFIGLCVLPVLCIVGGMNTHVQRSEQTRFCVSCHVMVPYGQSLYVDDPAHIPAQHFQNHRVPADMACYSCHAVCDYPARSGGDPHIRRIQERPVPALSPGRPRLRRESDPRRNQGFAHFGADVLPDQRLPRYRARCGESEPSKILEARSMKLNQVGIRRLLQVSSGLVIVGLLLEIVSLLWFHPLSFVLFAFVAATLIGLGILVYLVSLVFVVSPPAEKQG